LQLSPSMTRFTSGEPDKPIPSLSFTQCWAKTNKEGEPSLSVLDHCRIVGFVAQVHLNRLPRAVTSRLDEKCVSLIAAHDVGKISPGFQKKCQAWVDRNLPQLAELDGLETNHAVISEASVSSFCSGSSGTGWAEVLGAHHGGRRKKPYRSSSYAYGGTNWARERQHLIENIVAELGSLPQFAPSPEQLLLASGLTCIADWIGSDERYFPTDLPSTPSQMTELARQAVDACGWNPTPILPGLWFRHRRA